MYRLLRFFIKIRARSRRCSSFPKKVALRLCCSLVNALATLRLATNLFRGCEGSTLTSEKQIISFSCGFTRHRSFTPSLLLTPQSRRLCGDHKYKLHIVRSDFFIKVAGALTPLLLLSAKSHARLTCSAQNVLTTVRCRCPLFAGLRPLRNFSQASKRPSYCVAYKNVS